MSESHEIEQIARALDPGAYYSLDEAPDKVAFRRRYDHIFQAIEWKAAKILPLIRAAEERGAVDMRERAAQRCESLGGGLIMRAIAKDIRALPPIKEG